MKVGDLVPQTILLGPGGVQRMLSEQRIAGHPIVLCLFRRAGHSSIAQELDKLRDLYPRFAEADTIVLGLSQQPPEANAALAAQRKLPFEIWADATGALLDHLELPRDERALAVAVIEPNGRLGALFRPGGARPAMQALPLARKLYEATRPELIRAQAPILLVAGVFDAAMCKRLIEVWDKGRKRLNEVAIQGIGDPTYESAAREGIKRRADVLIEESEPLNLEIRDLFLARLVPEMVKAFHAPIKAYQTLRIGCYDASNQGAFGPHRDEVGDPKDPRLFACSINLNDEYTGCELNFPEYGRQIYRPEAGGAVIFSCNLLHEVYPCRSGRRFTLLTFFH
ncbi:redoxin domain-containing protein [Desertibaculum subflavum]|uniref:redoxin domain-containing protein n=1 Tax=Desertibaculum subflavum TaxID=2268458 RepID=UPI000E671436